MNSHCVGLVNNDIIICGIIFFGYLLSGLQNVDFRWFIRHKRNQPNTYILSTSNQYSGSSMLFPFDAMSCLSFALTDTEKLFGSEFGIVWTVEQRNSEMMIVEIQLLIFHFILILLWFLLITHLSTYAYIQRVRRPFSFFGVCHFYGMLHWMQMKSAVIPCYFNCRKFRHLIFVHQTWCQSVEMKWETFLLKTNGAVGPLKEIGKEIDTQFPSHIAQRQTFREWLEKTNKRWNEYRSKSRKRTGQFS